MISLVTVQDIDNAEDLLWENIFELVDAIKNDKGHYSIEDAKETLSMQIMEYGNVCWLRGRQNNAGGLDGVPDENVGGGE